jgi:predicted ATP-dependent serine protease
MRGLPGSGKSTTAQQIAEQATRVMQCYSSGGESSSSMGSSSGRLVATHSTDSYFIGADGVYRFDLALLQVREG